ncbi:hypothetical protein TNCV_440451 [Trichonephila clavipes]|nr:hypothetical protein TNCV_440451 [Trichonephila clavipes]
MPRIFQGKLNVQSPYYHIFFGSQQPSEADLTYARSFDDKTNNNSNMNNASQLNVRNATSSDCLRNCSHYLVTNSSTSINLVLIDSDSANRCITQPYSPGGRTLLSYPTFFFIENNYKIPVHHKVSHGACKSLKMNDLSYPSFFPTKTGRVDNVERRPPRVGASSQNDKLGFRLVPPPRLAHRPPDGYSYRYFHRLNEDGDPKFYGDLL